MLSTDLIGRLFGGQRYDRLLAVVVANGLELPLPLRVRLSQAPAGAVALGLRRAVELSYSRTPLSRQMAQFLLDTQDDNGAFEADTVITGAAAAALGRLLAEHPAAQPAVRQARERALAALAEMQHDDGLFQSPNDRTLEDRALAAAFVLFLLAGDDGFRQAVRIADLWNWFEQRHERLDRATERLWRMSRAETKAPRRRKAALAA